MTIPHTITETNTHGAAFRATPDAQLFDASNLLDGDDDESMHWKLHTSTCVALDRNCIDLSSPCSLQEAGALRSFSNNGQKSSNAPSRPVDSHTNNYPHQPQPHHHHSHTNNYPPQDNILSNPTLSNHTSNSGAPQQLDNMLSTICSCNHHDRSSSKDLFNHHIHSESVNDPTSNNDHSSITSIQSQSLPSKQTQAQLRRTMMKNKISLSLSPDTLGSSPEKRPDTPIFVDGPAFHNEPSPKENHSNVQNDSHSHIRSLLRNDSLSHLPSCIPQENALSSQSYDISHNSNDNDDIPDQSLPVPVPPRPNRKKSFKSARSLDLFWFAREDCEHTRNVMNYYRSHFEIYKKDPSSREPEPYIGKIKRTILGNHDHLLMTLDSLEVYLACGSLPLGSTIPCVKKIYCVTEWDLDGYPSTSERLTSMDQIHPYMSYICYPHSNDVSYFYCLPIFRTNDSFEFFSSNSDQQVTFSGILSSSLIEFEHQRALVRHRLAQSGQNNESDGDDTHSPDSISCENGVENHAHHFISHKLFANISKMNHGEQQGRFIIMDIAKCIDSLAHESCSDSDETQEEPNDELISRLMENEETPDEDDHPSGPPKYLEDLVSPMTSSTSFHSFSSPCNDSFFHSPDEDEVSLAEDSNLSSEDASDDEDDEEDDEDEMSSDICTSDDENCVQ